MRLAQLSMIAGAMLERCTSASDWVAKTTDDVALAQRLQPLADAPGEGRIVEEHPRFIEHQQRRRAVEALLEPAEQIAQHRQHRGAPVHQLFHLEALHRRIAQPVVIGIEQPAAGATQDVGLQRLAQLIRLQQHREAGERALLDAAHWRGCTAPTTPRP